MKYVEIHGDRIMFAPPAYVPVGRPLGGILILLEIREGYILQLLPTKRKPWRTRAGMRC